MHSPGELGAKALQHLKAKKKNETTNLRLVEYILK